MSSKSNEQAPHKDMYTGKLTFRSDSIPKRSRSSIHVAQLTKLRSAGRSRVWAGGMRHGRSPFLILSFLTRATQVYSSCYCSPTSVTTVYYGLIEVEGEFNGSDVGVSTASQRKKVGWRVESVDESQWQFAGSGGGGVRLL
jgi:hypothetical protein